MHRAYISVTGKWITQLLLFEGLMDFVHPLPNCFLHLVLQLSKFINHKFSKGSELVLMALFMYVNQRSDKLQKLLNYHECLTT